MSTWAHREAKALLNSKVEAGYLTSEAESRVKQYLSDGETELALELLVHGTGTTPVATN